MSDEVDPSTIHFRPIKEQDHTQCMAFSCGNSSMNNFLRHEAYLYSIKRDASTTLVFDNDKLIGYFTLRRGSINIENEERGSLNIERLAISQSVQNQGVGKLVVSIIIQMAYMINERYITLDALYEKKDWYGKLGFRPFIKEEYEAGNRESFVYMYFDTYDPQLLIDYFENP